MQWLRYLGILGLWFPVGAWAMRIPPCNLPGERIIAQGLGHNSFEQAYRDPFGAVPTSQRSVRLRFRTCRDNVDSVVLEVREPAQGRRSEIRMARSETDTDAWLGNVALWEAELSIPAEPGLLFYRFVARRGRASLVYANRDSLYHSGGWGIVANDDRKGYAISVYRDDFHVADWLRGAVIYQIFPDRFRNGDTTNDPVDKTGWIYGQRIRKLAWNEPLCDPRGNQCPGEYSNQFYGGDLAGIIDKLDYLRDLGVTAISLNPIFRAASNHRYDTQDYFAIDPYLGDQGTFQRLARLCKNFGLSLILDGVFNHTSADSPYFDYYDRWAQTGACESTSSPFRNWYWLPDHGSPGENRKSKSLVLCPRIPAPGETPLTYESFAGYWAMPRLNAESPGVQEFFFNNGLQSVAPYWIDQGASGFRLDVGDSVDPGTGNDPSHTFWRGMRQAIQLINPRAILLGEQWSDASPWLLGGQWDSAMNYRLRSALLDWMFDSCQGEGCSGNIFEDATNNAFSSSGPIHAIAESDLDWRLRSIQENYPPEAWQAMMNLLGGHDTNRTLFLLSKISGEDNELARRKFRFLIAFLFTYPGAPTIYFGDEVGVATPGKWDGQRWQVDPYNRAVYPWRDEGLISDLRLHSWVRRWAQLRARHHALREGNYRTLFIDDKQRLFAFARTENTESLWITFNRDRVAHDITLPAPVGTQIARDATSEEIYRVSKGKLKIPAVEPLGTRVLVIE